MVQWLLKVSEVIYHFYGKVSSIKVFSLLLTSNGEATGIEYWNDDLSGDAFACLININLLDWSTIYGMFTKENVLVQVIVKPSVFHQIIALRKL